MLKNMLRDIKRRSEIRLLRLQWVRHEQHACTTAPPVLRRLLIIPSDPWTLVGAKGDEAMMQAVVERLRRRAPQLVVGVVTATAAAARAAGKLGYVPVSAWQPRLSRARAVMNEFAADAVVVLGADVMDGYYNPVHTARFLLMADAAARRGARVAILGFSFNDRPHPALRPIFDRLAGSIAVNVRDALSLDRFQAFSLLPVKLVADAAFLLEPDERTDRVQAVRAWADARRAAGDRVLGFNLHPMLIKGATPQQVAALVSSAATALGGVAERRKVSLLLIPHDYRGRIGDAACLAPLHDALAPRLGERVRLLTGEHSAAELKAVAGWTDGVVTGRMHLAIAALGMGRPVAALTYQDKFQGLFGHFDLPQRFLLAPREAMRPEELEAMVLDFVDSLPRLAERVRGRLDAVRRAASLNLAGIETVAELSDADPSTATLHRPTFAA